MKLAVEFPSVAYREGPKAVGKLAKGIEDIGYDQLDVYDHVVMGYDIDGRTKSFYPAQMPIIEAFMMLSYAAAVTENIGLGTEVLVLPQRQPALVAKQVSSLDTLSDGRVRLGVGIGWQESEYEALGEDFKTRGRRMDEAMELLRAYWREERVGGNTPPAFRRVGKYGDGWLASQVSDADFAKRAMDAIREAAVGAGRDPNAIGWQSMIAPPPRAGDTAGKTFYAEPARVAARVVELKEMGFDGVAVNATAIFQSGSRSVDAMLDALRTIHDRLRQEVG